jgi:peptidoglycan hydrolase-like amidase
MSLPSRINLKRMAAAALAAGVLLGGCSDIYYDRRETIALGGTDAIVSNRVIQTVDPWPRHSENRNLAFNGQRSQTAVERYQHNKVIEPVSVTTSSAGVVAQQAAAAAAAQAIAASAAAPVK